MSPVGHFKIEESTIFASIPRIVTSVSDSLSVMNWLTLFWVFRPTMVPGHRGVTPENLKTRYSVTSSLQNSYYRTSSSSHSLIR